MILLTKAFKQHFGCLAAESLLGAIVLKKIRLTCWLTPIKPYVTLQEQTIPDHESVEHQIMLRAGFMELESQSR